MCQCLWHAEVDRRHALYLMEHLKPPLPNPAQEDDNRVGFRSVFEGSLFYLPDGVPLGSENRYLLNRNNFCHGIPKPNALLCYDVWI